MQAHLLFLATPCGAAEPPWPYACTIVWAFAPWTWVLEDSLAWYLATRCYTSSAAELLGKAGAFTKALCRVWHRSRPSCSWSREVKWWRAGCTSACWFLSTVLLKSSESWCLCTECDLFNSVAERLMFLEWRRFEFLSCLLFFGLLKPAIKECYFEVASCLSW